MALRPPLPPWLCPPPPHRTTNPHSSNRATPSGRGWCGMDPSTRYQNPSPNQGFVFAKGGEGGAE